MRKIKTKQKLIKVNIYRESRVKKYAENENSPYYWALDRSFYVKNKEKIAFWNMISSHNTNQAIRFEVFDL